jgi:hypothetical protein
MRQFYRKWRWITLEKASVMLPWEWWRVRVDPFCRGWRKAVRNGEIG